MITVRKRGKVWWAFGTVRKQRLRRSLHTTYRDVALARAKELEEKVWAGEPLRPMSWTGFVAEFLAWIEPHVAASTYRKYRFVLERFGEFLTGHRIGDLAGMTPALISLYCEERRRDTHPTKWIPVGGEGIKSDLRILRRVFGYVAQCGYIESNPVRVPRLNTQGGKTLPFTREEVSRMLADAWIAKQPEAKAKVLAFLYTGMRISDIAGMPKRAVNFTTGQITLTTRKRSKVVSIPVHPELSDALRAHLAELNPQQQASPFVFPTRTGRPLWPQSLDAELRRLFRRAGIEHGHAHRFRDTFAVALLEQGASLYDVGKLLGNTVSVVEKHYSPYVRELQIRGQRLVSQLAFCKDERAGERNQNLETGSHDEEKQGHCGHFLGTGSRAQMGT